MVERTPMLTALPPQARLNVRAAPADLPAIGALLGITPGTTPCRAVVAGERAALWLGPDEWLLLAPELPTADQLAAADALGSIVDVSHRSTGIDITGPGCTDTLNAFCALDLAEPAFPVGMCTRTLLGKAEIVLWRTGTDRFRIDLWRSFAPYVWGCLEEGRRCGTR